VVDLVETQVQRAQPAVRLPVAGVQEPFDAVFAEGVSGADEIHVASRRISRCWLWPVPD